MCTDSYDLRRGATSSSAAGAGFHANTGTGSVWILVAPISFNTSARYRCALRMPGLADGRGPTSKHKISMAFFGYWLIQTEEQMARSTAANSDIVILFE